jgi:hypothetical protein
LRGDGAGAGLHGKGVRSLQTAQGEVPRAEQEFTHDSRLAVHGSILNRSTF